MNLSRRKFVAGTGVALSVAGLGVSQATADEHDSSLQIVEVDEVEETVVIENTGDEAVDLAGYVIDWEYDNDDKNQTDEISEGVVDPGTTFTLWSGYESGNDVSVSYDYRVDDYGNGRINNDESDVIALLNPDGEAVATSEDVDSETETGSEDTVDEDADTSEEGNVSEDSGSEGDNSSDAESDDEDAVIETDTENSSDADSDDEDDC